LQSNGSRTAAESKSNFSVTAALDVSDLRAWFITRQKRHERRRHCATSASTFCQRQTLPSPAVSRSLVLPLGTDFLQLPVRPAPCIAYFKRRLRLCRRACSASSRLSFARFSFSIYSAGRGLVSAVLSLRRCDKCLLAYLPMQSTPRVASTTLLHLLSLSYLIPSR